MIKLINFEILLINIFDTMDTSMVGNHWYFYVFTEKLLKLN